jgi:hypothetical protein
VAPLDPFERLPEAFARIQCRGLGRQALSVELVGRPVGQDLLDAIATVARRAIPHEHYPCRDLAPQGLETRDHVVRMEGVAVAVAVPLALRRDGADRRELIAGVPLP